MRIFGLTGKTSRGNDRDRWKGHPTDAWAGRRL